MKINSKIGVTFLVSVLVLLYGCEQSISTNENQNINDGAILTQVPTSTVPTVANDGLVMVDVSGITASNLITSGTGTASKSLETINIEIPSTATVEQVYLYWARRGSESSPSAPTITIEGTEYTGAIIGGPVDMITTFENIAPVSYRLDLTSTGLIAPGLNSIDVLDNPADPTESLGASLLVFYSLASEESDLILYDGVDFIWADATAPTSDQQNALRTAEPVSFEFDPASTARSATMTLFVGDVEPSDAIDRPNSLKITIGGTTTILGSDSGPGADPVFQAFQGAEWDNFVETLTIPAGITQVTVEPVSGTGEDPASLVWSMAGLSISTPQQEGGQGCTPGYWRQPHHFDSWVSYNTGDMLDDPFNVPSTLKLVRPEKGYANSITLLEGVKLRGGNVNALIRHAVAALLNASNPDVSYDLSESEVISIFNAAVTGGNIEQAKNKFVKFNEQGCPLN